MNTNIYSLDNFELYKLAREFRKKIYKLIQHFPDTEKYCLAIQMRRAVISITNNIAEGRGRWHYQENIQFCRISRGSTEEIIDDLNICLDENYYKNVEIEQLKVEATSLIKKINGYIAYLINSNKTK